jgi:6-phosphofructokinase 2
MQQATILTLTLNPAIDKSTGLGNVTPDRKLRCGSPRFEPGGGGINVSRAIHALGGESQALYAAGGPPGKMLGRLLGEQGVTQAPIEVEGWTRENLTVYETSTEQQFRFGMPGPEFTEEEWSRCLEELGRADPPPQYVVASGGLPPGVPDDFYARVARLAKERGGKMILDTSGEPLSAGVREGVFLIKPNLRELEALHEGSVDEGADRVEVARKIVREARSQRVVVSLGGGGAIGVWEEHCEQFSAPTVSVRSKVGAGDSMVAGIVLHLARGASFREAMRFGLAAGAAAVMTPGSELCRREDAERLYERMGSGP